MERVPSFPLSYTNKHKAHTVGLCLPLRVCAFLSTALCVCVCVCVCVVFLCGSFSVCFSVCVKKQVNGFRFSVYGLQNHPGDFCFGDFFGFGRRSVCWLLLLISNKSV
jgi:hypothetical protein